VRVSKNYEEGNALGSRQRKSTLCSKINMVGEAGLRLVVQSTGAKSLCYRYEREDRKNVKVTLGRAAGPGALTLQQARDAANDARRLRSTGGDPADRRRTERRAEAARIEAEEREARRKDDTVTKVLGRYYTDHVDGLKSANEVKRVLNRELKGWAKRRIDSIQRTDAIHLLDTVKARAPFQSKRLRAYGRHFFGWCVSNLSPRIRSKGRPPLKRCRATAS
jgi:hypothetical protein